MSKNRGHAESMLTYLHQACNAFESHLKSFSEKHEVYNNSNKVFSKQHLLTPLSLLG